MIIWDQIFIQKVQPLTVETVEKKYNADTDTVNTQNKSDKYNGQFTVGTNKSNMKIVN